MLTSIVLGCWDKRGVSKQTVAMTKIAKMITFIKRLIIIKYQINVVLYVRLLNNKLHNCLFITVGCLEDLQ